jgi:hypothetical protein
MLSRDILVQVCVAVKFRVSPLLSCEARLAENTSIARRM